MKIFSVFSLTMLVIVSFAFLGCETTSGSLADTLKKSVSPGAQQEKARSASQYLEFTEAYMAKMPKQESGFLSSSEVYFHSDGVGMSYKVGEFKEVFENNDWGRTPKSVTKQRVLDKYLIDDIPTTNAQYKAFLAVCGELGLSVKKYRNDLLKFLYLPKISSNQDFYDQLNNSNRSFVQNMDFVWLGFDKNGEIKVIFSYEHEIFDSKQGTRHANMWALIWYGSSAKRAQQSLNNDLLSKYEVR